jgi:hypothetical protein
MANAADTNPLAYIQDNLLPVFSELRGPGGNRGAENPEQKKNEQDLHPDHEVTEYLAASDLEGKAQEDEEEGLH